MGYQHLTPGRRLLLFLLDGGGVRTVHEISRRNADGRLLAKARPELETLITEELGRSKTSKRLVRRIILTMKGWAACAMLRPGWQPRRLTTDVLRAWLLELQSEGDLWACQFIKDAADAAELKRLREIKWIRPPLKRSGPPKGFMPKYGFQVRQPVRKIQGRPDVAPPAVGSGPGWRPELSSPLPSSDAEFYERYVADTFGRNVPGPAAADVPPNSRKDTVEKADRFGFPTREHANDWQVMVNSRWISWREWNGEPPD